MKFLKELLANKRKLDEASHMELKAVCSAILQNKLPNKLKDLGSFTIPCLIGSLDVNNALDDLVDRTYVRKFRNVLGKCKWPNSACNQRGGLACQFPPI